MKGFRMLLALSEEARKALERAKQEAKEAERDKYEVSMLKAIDDAVAAGMYYKARMIIGMHKKRFPNSCVRGNIEQLESFIGAKA